MTAAPADAFWAGTAAGKLLLPTCRHCGNRWLPPTAACPRCLSAEVDWHLASGRGVVVAHCQFHRRYFPDLDLPLPYTVLLVRLEEGPLFYANPADTAAQPPVGTMVFATFVETPGGRTVARFAPQGERA